MARGQQKKMRQEFADTMLKLGVEDKRLVVLIGDISHFILQPFADACPGRFYNIGICEPTIVNMAAGLAKVGMYPVVHTIAPFIVERSFEQIKLDFGYQHLGVNLVTVGSAFDYGQLGCTHHCYDDFALLKNIEGSQIIYPASPVEFRKLFRQTYNNGFITYFRVPEAQHTFALTEDRVRLGEGVVVQSGTDVSIVAVGSQLQSALDARPVLQQLGISAEILYLHTVKPFDAELIRSSVCKTKRCLTIEEHGPYGGVADDVLRAVRDIDGVRCRSLNIGERFIHDYGTYEQLCDRLGLSAENVVSQAAALARVKQVYA
jgi:transketolase